MNHKAIISCTHIDNKNCSSYCMHNVLLCCGYCSKFATCDNRCVLFERRLNKLDLLLVYAGHVVVNKKDMKKWKIKRK